MELTTIQQIANSFAEAYKRELISEGHNASGRLASSAKALVQFDGRYLTVSMQLEPYWKYIEEGRKAGTFPPIEDIKQWIRVKPVLPRAAAGGKLPTENQLAYLIARSIAKKGIPASKTMEKTKNDFELAKALTKELSKLIKSELYE